MPRREWDSLEDEAEHLVRMNQNEVRSITHSYVFHDPDGKTIRVVHVDSKVFPEEAVFPLSFGPDPKYRLYHPMLVAIVDPTAPGRLPLPEGWGTWEEAVVIPRQARRKAG